MNEERQRFIRRVKALTPAQQDALAQWSVPRIVEEYFPHIPHPPQQLFLSLQGQEVLFGGAAGGGKSDALLMAALQYVDVPGYSALLLRRTWPDLSLPGAIMDRARSWLYETTARPKDGGRKWVFPSGAKLTFGYLQHDVDKYRYQSAEFQFIGFDELTQFTKPMYEYLFSRLRRPAIPCLNCRQPVRMYGNQYKHTNSLSTCKSLYPDPKVVAEYPHASDGTSIFMVPLRMRSATNPGGMGHSWVKEDFIDERTKKKDSLFVPSRLMDNPALDQAEYERALHHLNEVDRRRLLDGDWDVTEEGTMFQRHWFAPVNEIPADARMVRYWDLAATQDGGDYTAGALLALSEDGRWWIKDMVHGQWSPRETERMVEHTAMMDGQFTLIRMEQEPGASGAQVIDHYMRNVLRGYPFKGIRPSGSKEIRALPLSAAAEAGNVMMLTRPWNRDFLDEISIFPNGAYDDQVDALCGAMNELAIRRRSRLVV